MRILITGGAGFVGCNLARRAIEIGLEVAVLDDLSTGLRSNLAALPIEFVEGSIEDPASVAKAFSGVDLVYHLAARGSVPRSIDLPIPTHSVNSTGTLHVLEEARLRNVPVVFSSSSSVYGANPELPKDETMWTRPVSPYAASKLAGEALASAYAQSYGLPVTVFRFFNIFGPYQRHDHAYAAVIPRWLWAALHNSAISVYGDGRQSRDFTYVGTVVDALLAANDGRAAGGFPINLALGANINLLEVVDGIQSLTGRELSIDWQPSRIGDVKHSQNDPRLFSEFFPEVQATEFLDGLEHTMSWMAKL